MSNQIEPIDEIEDYWNGRYLSTGEAMWRILGFHITQKEPGVTALPVHTLDSCHHRQYPTHGRSDQTSLSLLDHYFNCPLGSFTHNGITREFANLTYNEYW